MVPTSLRGVEVTRHFEGYSDRLYLDTTGHLTGGYGHKFALGTEIPCYIAERFLWLDYKKAYDQYESLELDLDPVRRDVVVDMIFNLGLRGVKGFVNFLAAVESRYWHEASVQMIDSKWRRQVGWRRVAPLVYMMRTGKRCELRG